MTIKTERADMMAELAYVQSEPKSETVADVLADMRGIGHETLWNFAQRTQAAHEREMEELGKNRDAWQEFAAHLAWCAECAKSLDWCVDGKRLKDAARIEAY